MDWQDPSPTLHCHDGNTFTVRLDYRRLRQTTQSEIRHLNESIVMPDHLSLPLS